MILNKNQVIYVCVGGAGTSSTPAYPDNQINAGGYNGGGDGMSTQLQGVYGGSGGGATHIGSKNATLAAYGNTTGLFIVAGGGGRIWRRTPNCSRWIWRWLVSALQVPLIKMG